MNKNMMWFSGAVAIGFLVGFGIGKETRAAAESNVDIDYSDGIVTARLNAGAAVRQGISEWFSSEKII